MRRLEFTSALPRLRQLPVLTSGFLVATALLAVLIAPELAFGLQLRASLEPVLWGLATLAGVLFQGVVWRARWHWAWKLLACLFSVLCALVLLLRMAVTGLSVQAQTLALGGPCVAQVTHVGAFGDYQDNVHRQCAIAGLWMHATPLASYRRESVAALALLPATAPDVQSLALTLTEYGKPEKTVVLQVPARP